MEGIEQTESHGSGRQDMRSHIDLMFVYICVRTMKIEKTN